MEKILLPEITDLLSGAAPWIAIIVSVILVLMLKDWAANIAKGIKFYRDPAFMPGDRVYLDGELATIIDIGLTRTVFHIQRENENTWRYVPNTRIDYLKLEKILP
ncbi:mechanosensitive ion channel [bacterium]|nr:mechanosensitive ion channel [bacterium]MDC1257103.1 mechanosensitive ion channel [bacterium]